MIDWGNIPTSSKAQVYWPEVAAADVLALAARLYGANRLTAVDANAIGLTSVKGAGYIPIPATAGESLAGLFTVNLPLGVKAGREYNVLVRRIATQQYTESSSTKPTRAAAVAPPPVNKKSRYVTGAFHENPRHHRRPACCARRKYLGHLQGTPRSHVARLSVDPVLQRYIDYVSGRVDGSAATPPPSAIVPRHAPQVPSATSRPSSWPPPRTPPQIYRQNLRPLF